MAQVLETFDFTQQNAKTPRNNKGYPWGEWFDGRIWKITEGDDFWIAPLMMERQLRTRASPLRLSISIRHVSSTPGVIVFQATPLEEKTTVVEPELEPAYADN